MDEQGETTKQKPMRPRKYRYVHFLQRTLYDIQAVRIAAANRIEALQNTCKACGRRKKRSEKPRCKCFLPVVTDAEAADGIQVVSMVAASAQDMEKSLERPIRRALKNVKIYQWLCRQKGVGPRIAASLIALIDPIHLFDTISKLWAYGGLNPNATNHNHNWELKMLVCEKLVSQFILLGDKEDAFYRRLYDKIKAEYRERHPEPIETEELTKDGCRKKKYTALHIERMTKRKLAKIFLAHLWIKWRQLEGLSTRGPWIEEYGGHKGIIPPPE